MKWLDYIKNIKWLEIIKDYWWILGIISIVIIIYIRIKNRGYFWEDKYGNQLSFKEFMGRWRRGVEGITPVQQSLTSLWSYPLIFGGIITGIIINIINKTWWLLLILCGSLPITIMQIISLYQKYRSQKKAQDAYREAMAQVNTDGLEQHE
jgi:hypothetical protein